MGCATATATATAAAAAAASPCLLFSLPLGNRRSSFEPITQPRSSYHNQPCRLSNLGSAKLGSSLFLSCCAALSPPSSLSFFNAHKSKEGGWGVRRQTEGGGGEGEGGEGRGGRIVCTHLHTCLWGSSTNLGEDGCVGGAVSVLGNTVSETHRAFVSSC